MIVIGDRDKKIKEFLEVVGCADTNTIAAIFFPRTCIRNTQKRLKQLVDYKFIKVYRPNMLTQNIYYSKNKPRNIKHKILFSQLLGELHRQQVEILKYKCPYKLENIIADGLIVTRTNNQIGIYFVEGEISKKLNVKKYEDSYYSNKWKEVFPIFPTILVITDKRIKTDHKHLKIKKCKLDLSDLRLD